MRLSLIALPMLLLIPLQHPNKKPTEPQQAANADQRGTEQSPLVVKPLVPPKTQEETARDAKEREEKSVNDTHIVRLTGALAAIAFLQLLVYGYQAKKLRETVESAGKQSEAMERHIGEASRSATATEKIADTIEAGNRDVMRAYLTVVIGTALYQERYRQGLPDLRFEARPAITNTGNTPARNISIRIQADILPIPIPTNFAYPLTTSPITSAGYVAAHTNYTINRMVENFVPDADVEIIKQGDEKALCVWGIVAYDDIFGDSHEAKFGHWLTFLPNNTISGYYIPGQNDVS